MSFRTKLAKRILGKSTALSIEDFGGGDDWRSFSSIFHGRKKSGEISWNDWAAQRREYRGTTYACIRKIAPAVAAAPLHLFIPEGNSEIRASKRIPVNDEMKVFLLTRPHCKAIMIVNEGLEEITDHAALDVFKKANGSMTRSQLFDRTMIDMMLNGNAYWEPIENNAGAFPAQINMLPPERMKPIVKDGVVTGYALKRGFAKPAKKFEADEIVHFFYPNPHSISEGYSPVAAASQRISGEVLTSTFQNSTLENMGIPAGIIKIVRQMGPEKFAEFKKEFGDLYGGVRKANSLGFTQGEWELVQLGQTLQEMGYIDGAKMLREFIANTLQVPISKLTMESSNRAVADAGNTEFQRDKILPDLVMIAEELTESLIPMFPSLEDTGAFYMFENPVSEDLRLKIMQTRVLRTTGVSTPNNERPLYGLEPHDSEAADDLAPVRAPIPEQNESEVERMAKAAIDGVVDDKIDAMRNGDCGHEHQGG